jgi:Mce-associated membrane protein
MNRRTYLTTRRRTMITVRNWGRRRLTAVATVVGILAIGLIATAVVGYVEIQKEADVDHARDAAIHEATESIPKVLTYQPATVQADLNAASALLTGDFRSKFDSLGVQVIVPSAQEQGIATSASVVETSTVSASESQVTLLVFVNQSSTTAADPTPKIAGSRIKVTLRNTEGSWLISELSPV